MAEKVLCKEEGKREMEGGGEEAMGLKSKFSCCEENVATFFFLQLTNTVGLQASDCGNSTAFQRWRVICGMLCQVSGCSSYQGD